MSIYKLEPRCRVCLTYTTKVLNIFNKVPHLTSSFSSKVYCVMMECAPVQISQGDGLPQFICHSCVAKLDVAFRFRDRCIQSDIYLRTLPPDEYSYIDVDQQSETIESQKFMQKILCDICNKGFSSNNDLNVHRKVHVGERNFLCDQCPKRFVSHKNLEKHKQLHNNQIDHYKCTICNQQFPEKCLLNAHATIHTSYKCTFCDINFLLEIDLIHHNDEMHSKNDNKPFKCDLCTKTFLKKTYMERHKKQHSGIRPHKCDFCEKTFTLHNHLKIHRKVHTGERPFKCNICDKRFIANYHLEEHLRSHTGERPFECEICNKKFSQNSYLKKHLAIHTGESIHACNICNKMFVTQSCLRRHLRLHTGNRPYKCETCNKSFNESVGLKAHILTHTGERPFKCEFCDRGFIAKTQLKRHVKLQHKCDFCELYFMDKLNFDEHMNIHTIEVCTSTEDTITDVTNVVDVIDLKMDPIADMKTQDTWITVQYI